MNKPILLFTVVFLAGCSANLTRRQPYNAYIQQPRVLERTVEVCRVRGDLDPTEMDFDRSVPGQYLMIDTGSRMKDYYQRDVCDGPFREAAPGARVVLDKVLSYCWDGGFNITAYGTVRLDGEDVPFFYRWPYRHEVHFHWYGGDADYYLLRAPWDDAAVPEERNVGFMGKKYKAAQ